MRFILQREAIIMAVPARKYKFWWLSSATGSMARARQIHPLFSEFGWLDWPPWAKEN
jgi:hypothetical protein